MLTFNSVKITKYVHLNVVTMFRLKRKQFYCKLQEMSRILQEGQRSWSAWGKSVLVKDTAAGQTGIWTCAPQAEGSDAHKHKVELQIVRAERQLGLPVSLWTTLNSAGRFPAPPGWRLECCHNRCCLTRPIIICCTAVCPYPLFLLPLIPLHILLHLLWLLHHLRSLCCGSTAPTNIYLLP